MDMIEQDTPAPMFVKKRTPFVETAWSPVYGSPDPKGAITSMHTQEVGVDSSTQLPRTHGSPGLPSRSSETFLRLGQELNSAASNGMIQSDVPNGVTPGRPVPSSPQTADQIKGMVEPVLHMREPTLPRSTRPSAPNLLERVRLYSPGSTIRPSHPRGPIDLIDGTVTVDLVGTPNRGAVVPETTYDPASLAAPQWTATQTPATLSNGVHLVEDDFLNTMRAVLQNLPPSVRQNLSKEEITRVVSKVVEDTIRQPGDGIAKHKIVHQQHIPIHPSGHPQYFALNEDYIPGAVWSEAYEQLALVQPPMMQSDHEWYCSHGGGELPDGWTAHFDHSTRQWYYYNYASIPPAVSWTDPRAARPSMGATAISGSAIPVLPPVLPVPLPTPGQVSMPLPMPMPNHEDADWLASRFGTLQAQLQSQGSRGPVQVEMERECKENDELQRAIKVTRLAADEANKAAVKGDVRRYQEAQEDMVKARGKMDRLIFEAQQRKRAIPPTMVHYQGPTRGYDVDPALLRPRTRYEEIPGTIPTPLQLASQTAAAATSPFSGRLLSKFVKQRLPASAYLPAAYPLPPGYKYKGSSTPTPYAIPEYCFAWDMILRNRQTPQPFYYT